MKLLAIDSSGLVASVAIITDEELTAEYTVNYKKTHSQTLLPMLDEIVKMVEFDLKEVDAVAVAAGPGSFTGLRIGSATAKGLALGLNKPIVGVPTLVGLAYNLFGTDKLICPIMDAKRNQVYTGIYEFHGSKLQALFDDKAIGIEEIIKELNQTEREVIFLGDGVNVYKEIITRLIRIPCYFAPPHLSKQRAGAIGAAAAVKYREGLTESAAEHKPSYLRLSQAERERNEKIKEL